MKIVFFGDSITDMGRIRDVMCEEIWKYGNGYPMFVASSLFREDPKKYQVVNRGVSGDRIVDLYARIKRDVWNEKPDVLSILVGINDVWGEIYGRNGVELSRFEKIYEMLIEDTLQCLPNVKMILCEPFVLKGAVTQEYFDRFAEVCAYAKAVEKLATKYRFPFLPLQKKFDEAAAKHGVETYLYDGVHPNVAGATLIADEWCKLFARI